MHPKPNARRPRLWGLVLIAGLAGAVAYGQQPAQPPGVPPSKDALLGDVKVDAKTGALIVPVGGVVRFDPKLPEPPTDILISREDVLVVRLDPGNPRVFLLVGRIPGLTKLSFIMKGSPRVDFDVVVQPDYELLRNLIARSVPTASVEVTPGVGNVIILSGYVTSPQDADIITKLAVSQVGGSPNNVINAMQVGGVQQVQIDVVIASVSRTEARNRGFDFFIKGNGGQGGSFLSGLLASPPLGSVGAVTLQPSPSANVPFSAGVIPTQVFGALQALRTEGVAKLLAEPRIVTQTGRPAFFLSGGRTPTIGPTSGINGPGVQYEQIGVQLEVLPIVYGNGQIWLEINPINRAIGGIVNIGNLGPVPSFVEQQARCAVMLETGQTFAIGGLIQNNMQASSARLPVLGDLPYFGTLFSSVTHTETENELVILVTPRLVAPLDCCQVPKRLPGRETRNPDDYELFLEGILEAPRGQRKVWNGRCYNAAYKCDPSIGTFPCVGPLCTGPGFAGFGGGACGPNGCAAPVVARPVVGSPVATPAHHVPPAPVTINPAAPPAGTATVGGSEAVIPPAPLPVGLPAVPGAPIGPVAETTPPAGAPGVPAGPLAPVAP